MPGPVSDSYRPPGDCLPAIPVEAAAEMAARFGYEQIIIVARSPKHDTESVTTWGEGADNGRAACAAGDYLKTTIMKWPTAADSTLQALNQFALRKVLNPHLYRENSDA